MKKDVSEEATQTARSKGAVMMEWGGIWKRWRRAGGWARTGCEGSWGQD
jgi:hypothetical protein